jgi:NADH-quinone oxidoreductase subunit L
MFRLLFLTFFGSFRGTQEQANHLHESPKSMTIPLIVLAILSIFGGLLGLPAAWSLPNWMHHNLETIVFFDEPIHLTHLTEWILMFVAILGATIALYMSYVVYKKGGLVPVAKVEMLKSWQKPIFHKFYVDEIYDAIIRKPIDALSTVFYKIIDLQIIDGIVNGVGKTIKSLGAYARIIQSGQVGFYFVIMVISIIGILLFTILN